MSASGDSGDQAAGEEAARYYRSLDQSISMIHVQYADHWANYGPSGKIVAEDTREFPAEALALFQEIDAAEAHQLMQAGAARLGEEEERQKLAGADVDGDKPVAEGIGGWMVLPILGLSLTLIFSLVWMFRDYLPTLGADVWPWIPTSGRALITFEVFANLVVIVGSVTLLTLLFMKRRILPRLLVGFYTFVFFAVLADSIGVLVIGPELIPDALIREEVGWSLAAVSINILKTLLACSIWIPYFLLSTRVKRTFVNPLPLQVEPDLAVATSSLPRVVGHVTPEATRPDTAKKPPATWRWVLGVSVTITLAVLAVLVWKCADPGGMLDSASAGSSQTKTYTDPDYGFSIEYPAGWILREDEDFDANAVDGPSSEVSVSNPNGFRAGMTYYDFVAVVLFELEEAVDEAALLDIKAELEAYVEEGLPPGVELLEPLTEVVVGGASGFVVTATESLNGTPLTTKMYWLYAGKASYTLLLQSGTETLKENQAAFQAIIDSFRPGPLK